MRAETPHFAKHPANPILGPGLGTCFDLSVLEIGGRFRMWFSWRDRHSIAHCESADGSAWGPPTVVLEPRPSKWYQGPSRRCSEVTRPAVLFHEGAYHMWYSDHTRTVDISYARSPDGIRWQDMRRRVLRPEGGWEKQAVMCPCVSFDPAKGLFRMWYSAGERHEPDAVGHATSPDGLRWNKDSRNPVFRPDTGCPWEKDRVTGMHVIERNGGHLGFYIGFGSGFEKAAIGAAWSPDGVTGWERCAGNPLIQPGPAGSWDDCNVYKPFVLEHQRRLLLWYNASRASDRAEQIGLATSPA